MKKILMFCFVLAILGMMCLAAAGCDGPMGGGGNATVNFTPQDDNHADINIGAPTATPTEDGEEAE